MNFEMIGYLTGFLIGVLAIAIVVISQAKAGGVDTWAITVLLYPIVAWAVVLTLLTIIKSVTKAYASSAGYKMLVFVGCVFGGYSWPAAIIAGYLYL